MYFHSRVVCAKPFIFIKNLLCFIVSWRTQFHCSIEGFFLWLKHYSSGIDSFFILLLSNKKAHQGLSLNGLSAQYFRNPRISSLAVNDEYRAERLLIYVRASFRSSMEYVSSGIGSTISASISFSFLLKLRKSLLWLRPLFSTKYRININSSIFLFPLSTLLSLFIYTFICNTSYNRQGVCFFSLQKALIHRELLLVPIG